MKIKPFVFVLAAAFASVTHAQSVMFDRFMGTVVGNNTTVGFGSGGVPLATSAAGLGTPSIGNMGLSQAGTGVSVAGNVKAPLGGTSKYIDAVARAPITRNAFLAGLGAAASNPLVGIGIAIAAPAIMDWLSKERVGINPDQSDPQKPFTQEVDILDCVPLADPGWPDGSPDRYSYTWTSKRYNATKCIWGWDYRFDGGPLQWKGWAYSDFRGVGGQRRPITLAEAQAALNTQNAPLTPQAVEQGVKAGIDPFGGLKPEVSVSGPAVIPGEKTTTTETVKVKPGTTTIADPSDTVTDPATKTTVKQDATKIIYEGDKISTTTVTTTTTNITNNITNQTTTDSQTPKIEEKEQAEEIKTCGLPGTPPCKIDEKGTPEAKEDKAADDIDKAKKPLDDFLKNPTSALPTFPTINWAFTLPSGCAPIALPAFAPYLQEIDVCAFQPMFHDLMSFVWVMGGIFGAIGTFWRNTFSQS